MQDQPIGAPAPGAQPANWYPDPQAKDQLRYWDGTQWTSYTRPSSPQTSVGAQAGYRPLHGLAITLQVMLGVYVLLMAGAVASDLAEVSLLTRLIEDPGSVTAAEANSNDMRQLAFAGSQLLLLAATAIVFIVWFYRAYSNVPALGLEPLRYGRGWAIGGWFVPILWFWRPKQIANDIWRGSDPDQPARQDGEWHKSPVGLLLGAWWAVWIISGFIGNIVFRQGFSSTETVEELRAGSQMLVATDSIEIVSALLALAVVVKLTARQRARAERVSSASPSLWAG